jgi:hypothetical protein
MNPQTASGAFVTLDPTFEPPAEATRPKGQAARPATLDGAVVGLLSNGKANGMALLEAVVAQLRERYPIRDTLAFTKGSVSIPPRSEDFERLVREANVVITAIGD